MIRTDLVPRAALVVAALFLALLTVVAVAQWDAWPFTGWQLFSQVRTADQSGWRAAYVDDRGTERSIPFGQLPRSYRGALGVLKSFPSFSSRRRTAVCDTWADALEARGAVVREVLVYRTHTHMGLGAYRAVTTRKSLAYRCTP